MAAGNDVQRGRWAQPLPPLITPGFEAVRHACNTNGMDISVTSFLFYKKPFTPLGWQFTVYGAVKDDTKDWQSIYWEQMFSNYVPSNQISYRYYQLCSRHTWLSPFPEICWKITIIQRNTNFMKQESFKHSIF